ncbi:hypothetical protein DKX38_024895 [Salix brachista]|uniref:PHD finger-like domain-containing protein 5A n=1 Tax=Salix brachista TaxID=2182728 RepID=A0A5N5JPF0_9ROSI|nr:hypothetical protein DKX38_024895 [Salix brachista]
MAKHHPDLIMCRKQPGIAIGRLCEKCDGKCVICDSYVRPCTLVRVCDECNYGSFQGRCVICGGVGISDAYYCKECTQQEKDRDGCPKIVNLGSAKTDLFYELVSKTILVTELKLLLNAMDLNYIGAMSSLLLGCVYQVLLVVLPSVEINVASIAITVCLILSSQVIMFRETGVLGIEPSVFPRCGSGNFSFCTIGTLMNLTALHDGSATSLGPNQTTHFLLVG